jgi:D-alanyl-D-alanine dipeptidase
MRDRLNSVFAACFVIAFLPCCKVRPPRETGVFRQPDLVELVKLDTSIHLDIRYATANNFTGHAVYKQARAFLERPAAEALVQVSADLRSAGLGLVVFDGYRPWDVTREFWNITPDSKKQFVADPKKGSRHNRGCAVDLTLYDLASGAQIEMTSGYDEMTDRAYPGYSGGTDQQRKMRDLLRKKMESHGFTVYPYEWWHFDFNDWRSYPIINIPFSEIK